MNMITQHFEHIRAQIKQAEATWQRQSGSVLLLAVSKTMSELVIAKAYNTGQRHFGENYLQEAIHKQKRLSAFDISWHFIGPVQSNKTRAIAQNFSWVHSVDNTKIAKRLSDQRPDYLPPLNICLQVNISEEVNKAGIKLDELGDLCAQVEKLPNLRLRGVMAIPENSSNFEQQRLPYRTLHNAVLQLQKPELDTFSYGMSGDLQAAIAEGASIVRIGTALFGKRD
jgi:pyridoxal phosphate enzyme (YggS family)